MRTINWTSEPPAIKIMALVVLPPDAWHIGEELGGKSKIKVSQKSKLAGPFNRGDTIINKKITFTLFITIIYLRLVHRI